MSSKKAPPTNLRAELKDRIVAGLDLAYQKMLEFKRQKNTDVVVMREGKIVRIKP